MLLIFPRDGSKINYSRQLEVRLADSWVCSEKKAAVRCSDGSRISQAEELTGGGGGGGANLLFGIIFAGNYIKV